ncbi:hypothetical protein GCM10007894_07080 [Paraferrimonas haliotis]|uniref:Uncharacterized protein n=1 Tax=Paraferrimonas haliotis TaxID=2013866 RepID=A0AA37WY74_9GAMM|nr:hypothetical protein GCM10007894_07080 [Paraferrimonas haliotis]
MRPNRRKRITKHHQRLVRFRRQTYFKHIKFLEEEQQAQSQLASIESQSKSKS